MLCITHVCFHKSYCVKKDILSHNTSKWSVGSNYIMCMVSRLRGLDWLDILLHTKWVAHEIRYMYLHSYMITKHESIFLHGQFVLHAVICVENCTMYCYQYISYIDTCPVEQVSVFCTPCVYIFNMTFLAENTTQYFCYNKQDNVPQPRAYWGGVSGVSGNPFW